MRFQEEAGDPDKAEIRVYKVKVGVMGSPTAIILRLAANQTRSDMSKVPKTPNLEQPGRILEEHMREGLKIDDKKKFRHKPSGPAWPRHDENRTH